MSSSARSMLLALLLACLSQPKSLLNVVADSSTTPSPSPSAVPSPPPSRAPSSAPSAAPTLPPFNASTMTHLLDIYTVTDGRHWGTSTMGWNFSRDAHTKQYAANPCLDRWSFLTCGANNDIITGLDLSYVTIDLLKLKSLPAGLFELTDLTTLVIANIKDSSQGAARGIYCTLPSAVGNMRRLETLRITLNSGKCLGGSLPSSLGELTNLKVLNLNSNAFNNSLPSSLGKLKALQSLDLSFNSLEGMLAASFSGLSHLTCLDLSRNSKLTPSWLPKEMTVLPSLRLLDLHSTNLSGHSIPTSIGTATSLTRLNLESSSIIGSLPSSLGTLKMLRFLSINGHHLHGIIPSELAALSGLAYLSLEGKLGHLTGPIPSAFGLARSLMTFLDLSNNMLTGTITSELCRLTGLVYLELSSNNLRGQIPSSIGDMKSLTSLALSSNLLRGVLPEQLYSLTALLNLNFANNLLSGTISPLIGNFASLTFLDISSNKFRGQLAPQLGHCLGLRKLYVYKNSFSGPITDSLCTIAKFQDLRAYSNNFTCYPNCLQTMLSELSALSYCTFEIDPFVHTCYEGPLASGYLVTSLFADEKCKKLVAETRVMAGLCLRQKRMYYKVKVNASELAEGYVTSTFERFIDDGCNVAVDLRKTLTVPQMGIDTCYTGNYTSVVDTYDSYVYNANRHLQYFYVYGINEGKTQTVYALSPNRQFKQGLLPVANAKATEEVLNLLYYNPDPVRSIRVSFVHVDASIYYTTNGSTSHYNASPFVRKQGYLVKSAYSQNQTRCKLDLAPSQTAIIPAGTCFNFTDGLPVDQPALLSKLFFCHNGAVNYLVFPRPGCCIGDPDSQCMQRASSTFAYGRECAEHYEGVLRRTPQAFTNDDVMSYGSGNGNDDFYGGQSSLSRDDDYLLQAKVYDGAFNNWVDRSPHFLPPSVPPKVNLTRLGFSGHGVDPSANSSWSCVSPIPAGRPLPGLATVTTFSGPRCVVSAIQCELRVALGVCYKDASSSSSSGSYKEHYLEPGSWGVLSYDIIKSSFPNSLDCSGSAPTINVTTTFLKDTCIADPAKDASYKFEWAGSAAEESYQFQQAERDAASIAACDINVGNNATSSTQIASHKGVCSNVVKGTAASGLALADNKTQAYAVKIFYSDAYCNLNSMVSEESHLIGDGTCFELSGGGSYRIYMSRCGAVTGLSSSGEAPDVISLHYSRSECEGKATGYDSSLTGQSACFVSAFPAGSYTIHVVTGSLLSLPRVPDQLSGYAEFIYKSESDCKGKASSLPLLRRAYSPSSCVSQAGNGGSANIRSCHSALSFQLDRVSSAVALISGCGSRRSMQKTYLAAANIIGLPPSTPASICARVPSDMSFFPLVPSSFATLPAGFYSSVACLAQTTSVFQQELQDQRNQYALLTFMSVVSLCASLLMLAVIINLNKYTDAILILLVLTCCQLCYDASFILPFQPADMPISTHTFDLYHRSVFLTRFFGLASIMVSNYLAFVVAYIIFSRRTFPARRFLPLVCAAIFAVSLIITACLTAATPGYDEVESVSNRILYADSLLALRGFQIACILFNLIAVAASYAKIIHLRNTREGQSSKIQPKKVFLTAASSYKPDMSGDPLVELCKRLSFYPLVQALTQFPVMWSTFAYQLDAQGHFPRNDDDFYTTETYRAYAYCNALLVPSSGLLFAIVFFAFQPGALRELKRLSEAMVKGFSTAHFLDSVMGEADEKPVVCLQQTQTKNPLGSSLCSKESQAPPSINERPVGDLDDDELGTEIARRDVKDKQEMEVEVQDARKAPRLGSIYASQEVELAITHCNPSIFQANDNSIVVVSDFIPPLH